MLRRSRLATTKTITIHSPSEFACMPTVTLDASEGREPEERFTFNCRGPHFLAEPFD